MAANTAAQQTAGAEVLDLGLRGVYLVPNRGQWSDAGVAFGYRSREMDIAFRESKVTMYLKRVDGDGASREPDVESMCADALFDDHTPCIDERDAPRHPAAPDSSTVTIMFPGSNRVWPVGGALQTTKFNYFVGGRARLSASNVPSFRAVIYRDLYDGVDLHVMGNDDGVFKYEFHVAPGGDWSEIRIAYDGVGSMCLEDSQDLRIQTPLGTLTDSAPLVWQDFEGTRCFIPAHFELLSAYTYSVVLDGSVDMSRELIIDPEVEWMTYLGGGLSDKAEGVAIATNGDIFVVGTTTSFDFDGRRNLHHEGLSDAFILRTFPSGEVRWMTYLGGSNGDEARDVAVDSTGATVVTGRTWSEDFEGRINAHFGGGSDGYFARVGPDGQVQRVVFVGGSGIDYGYGIDIDHDGNIFIAGQTRSQDFVGRLNEYLGRYPYDTFDAFFLKADSEGTVQWMTYVGGTDNDSAQAVAIDAANRVLMAGWTVSTDFIGRNNRHHSGEYDGFAMLFDQAGGIEWMTYVGGGFDDFVHDITCDVNGGAFGVGQTNSFDFERRLNSENGGWDQFVMRINASGEADWMRYIGGPYDDQAYGVAAAPDGGVVAVGEMPRPGYPHDDDVSLVELGVSGELEWQATFGGRAGGEVGNSVTIDEAGRAIVVGSTTSTDFVGRRNSH